MADTLNDGDLPNGCRLVTIGGIEFTCEAWDFTDPSRILTEMNYLGLPSKQVAKADFRTGSATLQVPTSSTFAPANRIEFTSLDRNVSTTFFIVTVGQPETNDGIKKYPIEFRKKIN